MPTFEVDDQLHSHPKAAAAGDEALGLWVRAGSWCAAYLTDGRVPWGQARRLGGDSQWDRLVDAGLVDKLEDGSYQLHDYLHWNRPATYFLNQRAKATEKKRDQRARARAQSKVSHRVSPGDVPNPVPALSPVSPSPSPSYKRSDQDTSSSARPSRADEQRVFDLWQQTHMPKAKCTKQRLDRIRKRMADGFDADTLCAAILGALKDDWLMGRAHGARPGGWRDIDTILRDAAQVERLSALVELDDEPVDDGPWSEPPPPPIDDPPGTQYVSKSELATLFDGLPFGEQA